MSTKAVRIGIGGPVGCRKTKLFERLLPLMHGAGLKLAAITNDLVTLEHAMRLSSSGSRRDWSSASGRLRAEVLGLDGCKFERRQNSKIAKLEETLRSRRVVNNAVRHLAAERSISEEHAYQCIRRWSLEGRASMTKVADQVLACGSELSDPNFNIDPKEAS